MLKLRLGETQSGGYKQKIACPGKCLVDTKRAPMFILASLTGTFDLSLTFLEGEKEQGRT